MLEVKTNDTSYCIGVQIHSFYTRRKPPGDKTDDILDGSLPGLFVDTKDCVGPSCRSVST